MYSYLLILQMYIIMYINFALCLDTNDDYSAVQNLTALSVGSTSITIGWSVSSHCMAK